MTRPAARIAFLVTHLMGSGHLVRTLAIARAVMAAGGEALVISGGRFLAHLDAGGAQVAWLPPLTIADLDYKTLRRTDGEVADAAYMTARRAAIADALAGFVPDVLATELYPFGRRALAAEFEAAIAVRPAGCKLAVSIRDVLEPPSKPKRAAETCARLAPYDLILCHGDPAILPLAASWPGGGAAMPDAVTDRLAYTGYVAAPAAAPAESAGDVLVSVGAGPVGRALLEMAARAAAMSDRPWRLLVGGADAAAEAARLMALGPAMAEPPRSDYSALLRGAALSISLAGYNTAVEAALRGGPSILIPMEEGGEQEQILRANGFAGLPGVTCLRIGDLTPMALARAAEIAIAATHRAPTVAPALRADGARPALRASGATPALRASGATDSARRLIALARA
ncbi:MAG: putative glycosyltransferase [Paracoccaceae bacterium]|jgi:predicted glycosyltransferase